MKAKVFMISEGDGLVEARLESRLNAWLKKNQNIEIVSMQQSLRIGGKSNFSNALPDVLILTIVYK